MIMLAFGARSPIGRTIVLSAALIVSAASAVAAASPGELQQFSASCIPAAPSLLVSEQGLWVGDNGLPISGFGAAAQPIRYFAETARWLSSGTSGAGAGLFNFPPAESVAPALIESNFSDDALQQNRSSFPALTELPAQHLEFLSLTLMHPLAAPKLTRDLFNPTPMAANSPGFSRGPLPQPAVGSFTIDDFPPDPATVGRAVNSGAKRR